MNPEWEEAIAIEDAHYAILRGFAREHADTLAALWRIGDGNGGGILHVFRGVIGCEYPEVLPENRPRAKTYRKATISAGLRRSVYERDAYRCVICGTWEDLTLDHVIAESKGGPTTFDNLQAMCMPCNVSKGTR